MSPNLLTESTLASVCNLVTDGTHDTPQRVESGYPLIKAKEITGGRIDFETCDEISKEEHLKVIARSKPEFGDTLFAHIGASLGEAAFVNTSREFSIKNIALFKPNPAIIDARYLYYLVVSPAFQALAKSTKTGSAQPFLGLGQLRGHHIQYHSDLAIQRRIATMLSAYDELMANTERRIRILEVIARAFYREWFVNFQFSAEARASQVYKSGELPDGWQLKNLKDVCDLTMGQSPRSEFYNDRGEGMPFHQGVTDFDARFPKDRLFCTAPGRIAQAGDILFSVRAPVGRLNIASKRIVVGRGLSAIRHRSGHQAFLWEQLREKFQEENTMGNGAIFPAVTRADVESIELLCPTDDIVGRATGFLEPIHGAIATLAQAVVNLRRTRDLLLPDLMSGRFASSL